MATDDNASTARSLYEAVNNRDLDQVASLVADQAEWHDVPTGRVSRGPTGLTQMFKRWLTWFPDGEIEVTNLVCARDWCAVEYTGRGTNTGPLAGPTGEMPPTGRRAEVAFCDVFEVKNGKVTRGRTYFDLNTMLQQLGLTPTAKQAGQ